MTRLSGLELALLERKRFRPWRPGPSARFEVAELDADDLELVRLYCGGGGRELRRARRRKLLEQADAPRARLCGLLFLRWAWLSVRPERRSRRMLAGIEPERALWHQEDTREAKRLALLEAKIAADRKAAAQREADLRAEQAELASKGRRDLNGRPLRPDEHHSLCSHDTRRGCNCGAIEEGSR